MKLGSDHIMKWLDRLYDLVVEDSPILESAQDIGNHYAASTGSLEERARRLIRWQVMKAGTSGFLSGLGGVIAMPVAMPANIASVMYVQIRMIAAVAHLSGHDIRNDQVRTLCYACMCGKAAGDVVKDAGIKLGAKLIEQAIKKVPGKVLKKINKEVGFRLLTKFGSKGTINFGKMIPIAGGVVGGTFDASSTYVIGKIACTTFIGAGENAKRYERFILTPEQVGDVNTQPPPAEKNRKAREIAARARDILEPPHGDYVDGRDHGGVIDGTASMRRAGGATPTKNTKESNQAVLHEAAERLGVKEFLEKVASFIEARMPSYRWPHETGYYSFTLHERSEGKPTARRRYATLHLDSKQPGSLLLTLTPRAVEVACDDAVNEFCTDVPVAFRNQKSQKSYSAIVVGMSRDEWPTISKPLGQLLSAIVDGWKQSAADDEEDAPFDADSRSRNNMINPWLALPSSPPYVLPDDRTCVEAFNAKLPSDSRCRIEIEAVIPEPFVGAVKTAPVVVLQLNPGFGPKDATSHADPEFRTALISNLRHVPSKWPFYFFDPRFRDAHPGGRWWIEKTSMLAEVIPLSTLAQRLAVVEWFPYKSTQHKSGSCRVLSQVYGFSLVASAMERGALVVIARSVALWERSVPALQNYPRKLTLSSRRNVVLTPNNMVLNGEKAPAAWELLVNALRGVHS